MSRDFNERKSSTNITNFEIEQIKQDNTKLALQTAPNRTALHDQRWIVIHLDAAYRLYGVCLADFSKSLCRAL